MNRITIGLVGEKGAGKETFCKVFREVLRDQKILASVDQFRFSDTLTKTLEEYDIEVTRENQQALATFLRSLLPEAIANGMRKLLSSKRATVNILDGVRWPAEEEFVKGSSYSIMLYVTANADVRFGRLSKRKEKADEQGMTREQFDSQEKAATEIRIREIGSRADFKIENNRDDDGCADLRKRIRIFVKRKVIPMLRAKK